MVSKYTNDFHILCTKLGIKDSEQHLILKYCSGLHCYIQTDMDFFDISSLRSVNWYVVKIEEKFQQKNKWDSRPTNTPQKQGKENPGPQNTKKENDKPVPATSKEERSKDKEGHW